MEDRYFDDFQVGETFLSQGATLSESQILDFALRYDPQPFHMNVEAARESPYGGLIASGWQTLALASRLILSEKVITACSLGSPGVDELRWLKPVRPGDTLRVKGEFRELTPSRSKPDRGIAKVFYEVSNQNDEVVMSYFIIHMLARRLDAPQGK